MHLEKIKSLIDLLCESPLAEIELIEGDHAIRLTRRATAELASGLVAGSASHSREQSTWQPAFDAASHALPQSEFSARPQGVSVARPASAAAHAMTTIDAAFPGAIAPAAASATDAVGPMDATDVTAPMFGIVHLRPAPDAAPFVHVGQRVEAGATLCTIEAMKTFNAVEAEIDGTIVEVVAVTGTDVEAGNILFRIAP